MAKYITLQPRKILIEFRDRQTASVHGGQLAVTRLPEQFGLPERITREPALDPRTHQGKGYTPLVDVNGKKVGEGDNFHFTARTPIASFLHPGENVIAVAEANSSGGEPNPAGWIGAFDLSYTDGSREVVKTDSKWSAGLTAKTGWEQAAISGGTRRGKQVDFTLFATTEADRTAFADQGWDANSLVCDPLFVDAAQADCFSIQRLPRLRTRRCT